MFVEGTEEKANYIGKCKFCEKKGWIKYIPDTVVRYKLYEKYGTFAKFNCTGIELVEFVPKTPFRA